MFKGQYLKYPLLFIKKITITRRNNLYTVSNHLKCIYNYLPRKYFIDCVNFFALSQYTFNSLKLNCDIKTSTCVVDTVLIKPEVKIICFHPVVRQQSIQETRNLQRIHNNQKAQKLSFLFHVQKLPSFSALKLSILSVQTGRRLLLFL